MIKDLLKGIATSERVWMTLAGLIALALVHMGAILPDDFTTKLADMIMVLVASFGLRPPRPKGADAAPTATKTVDAPKPAPTGPTIVSGTVGA